MSREDDFATRMKADGALMLILTGGVYTSGAVGPLGIARDTVAAAFDSNGWLKPCALVKQRGRIPTGDVVDYDEQMTSARQIVEIWLYCDQGSYSAIDSASARLYKLFQGHQFSDSFEIHLVNVIDRQRDQGALAGAFMARLDWQVDSIIQ